MEHVIIYTDGCCIDNPGRGGYGVVLINGKERKELSGGFQLTTNNRMELMAAIIGLSTLQSRCTVTLYSDSRYLVDAMQQGWAKQWRARGWRKTSGKAQNPDLWKRLLDLCDRHEVTFKWVEGHTGNAENERCDRLSNRAAQQPDLQFDQGYEDSAQAQPSLWEAHQD